MIESNRLDNLRIPNLNHQSKAWEKNSLNKLIIILEIEVNLQRAKTITLV